MKTVLLRKSRDIGDIITDSFAYLRIHFKSLGKGLLFFSLPLIIISGILIGTGFGTAMAGNLDDPNAIGELANLGFQFIAGFFLLMLTFMFIIVIVFKHIQLIDDGEETIEPSMLLEGFARNIFGVWGILVVISIVSMIGFFLFIIPGIYVAFKLSLAPAIYVIEEEDFGTALSKSWQVTTDYWWFTFGTSFIMSIIMNVVSNAVIVPLYIVMMVVVFSTGEPNMELFGSFFSVFYGIGMIAVGLLYCFPVISQALVYFNLEERKTGNSLSMKIDSLGNH